MFVVDDKIHSSQRFFNRLCVIINYKHVNLLNLLRFLILMIFVTLAK